LGKKRETRRGEKRRDIKGNSRNRGGEEEREGKEG